MNASTQTGPPAALVEAAHKRGWRIHRPPVIMADGLDVVMIAPRDEWGEGWRRAINGKPLTWISAQPGGVWSVEEWENTLRAVTRKTGLRGRAMVSANESRPVSEADLAEFYRRAGESAQTASENAPDGLPF